MKAAFVFEGGRTPAYVPQLVRLNQVCSRVSAFLGTKAELLLQHSLKADSFAVMVRFEGVFATFGKYDADPIDAIRNTYIELEAYLEELESKSESTTGKEGSSGCRREDSARKRSNGLCKRRREGKRRAKA